MSKPVSYRGPYYMGFKDNMYKVDPAIFAKMSTKFENDYPLNKDHMEFTDNVADESFKAFIASCQLKSFDVLPLYALEVLEISRKWGCPSLEQYCINVCKKNGIIYRPRNDVLGILLQHIDEDCETVDDLKAVAEQLNELFEDDRLPDVEPELLFRIVLMAQRKGLDMEKLINFVIQLIKTVPESAVLLSLCINFDLLPEDQEDLLFHIPEMHQMSLNFFVAQALSSVRYNTRQSLNEISALHQETLDNFISSIEQKKKALIEKLQSDHDAEMDEVMTTLEDQHATIEELSDILAEQARHLDSGPLSANGIGDPNINKIRNETEEQIKTYRQALADGLDDNKRAVRVAIRNAVEEVKQEWISNMTDPEKVNANNQKKLAAINEVIDENDNLIEEIEDDIDEMKCIVASQIVRDKLRTEKGSRNVADPYRVFDDQSIWELNREDVQKAEKFIVSIEERLDAECPIRGGRKAK